MTNARKTLVGRSSVTKFKLEIAETSQLGRKHHLIMSMSVDHHVITSPDAELQVM